MGSKTPENTPSSRPSSRKRYYQLKLFWFVMFLIVLSLITLIFNWALNHDEYQSKAVRVVEQLSKTSLKYSDLHFNLFSGVIEGNDLEVHVKKSDLKISLTEFKLNYNPVYLFLGRFKISRIFAKEIWLDTSTLKKTDSKSKPIQVPKFLTRIKLKEAKVERFFWSYPEGGFLAIDEINLTSKFGAAFHKSPLKLTIDNFVFYTKKLHTYADRIELDGYFLLDFSNPRIFDDSKISLNAKISDVLVSIYRKPKPWLTERAYDQDLEPVLKKYYPGEIPKNRSYLFVKQGFLDAQKTQQNILLNNMRINYHNTHLIGQGKIEGWKDLITFKLKTSDPMPLSKLPLGQAKFRQAFDSFEIAVDVKGKFKSIEEHNFDIVTKAKLIGNLVHPEAGDAKIELNGNVTNQVLKTKKLQINIADGQINADGQLNLKTLETNTTAEGTKVDAQTVVRLFSSINIPSKVDAKGTIKGPIKNPQIDLSLQSDNAMYEFLNFGQAGGTLIIKNDDLKLSVASQNSEVGQSQLTLAVDEVFSPFDNKMVLDSKFSNIQIDKLLNAPSMTGSISGDFDLKRINAIVDAKGSFQSQNFAFFEHPIGDIDFSVKIFKKHLDVKPITVKLKEPVKTIQTNQGLSFDFNDFGYSFKGEIIKNLRLSGDFKKANKQFIHLVLEPTELNLEVFQSLLPLSHKDSKLSGKFDVNYSIYEPLQSRMNSNIRQFFFRSPDGQFDLIRPTQINYAPSAFQFRNTSLKVGNGNITLNGPISFTNGTALNIKGDVDFTPLVDFNPYISESESPITVDVTLKDDIRQPKVYGKAILDGDTIRFRKADTDLENIHGKVSFDNTKVTFDKISLEYDTAPVTLQGHIIHDYEKITGGNLAIVGKEVPLRPIEGLTLLSDVDLLLRGNGSNLTLKGDMNVVEGLYSRDFTVTNFILSPTESELEGEEADTFAGLPLKTKYNLRIKNTGEMLIKNNIAEIEMNTELDLGGTIERPDLSGQLDFLGGQVNAFGINFDDANGYALFRKGKGLVPDINLTARKEIQGYNIAARIQGYAENLKLRLISTPALSHREILSVIFYGRPPDQLTDQARQNFTRTAAISQLASILASPISKLSGLDLVRVTSRIDRPTQSVQRLSVGKRLSNRFDLSFTTDLGGNANPERAFELRYQLFDNFYLISAKDVVGASRYRFDMSFRYEFY